MRRLAVLALLLASCGGSGVGAGDERNINVAYGVPSNGGDGLTEYGEPTVITLLTDPDPVHVRSVCIHELLHAMGLEHHLGSPACWMYDGPGWLAVPNPEMPLCDVEYQMLSNLGQRLFNVHCGDPDLWPIVAEACGFLNANAPYAVLALDPAPTP